MISIARRTPPHPRMSEPDDERRLKKPRDKQPEDAPDNPGTGRTSKLGRNAETPASIRSTGPSGQSGRDKHQVRHPNK